MELLSCDPPPRKHRKLVPVEFKVIALREFPTDSAMLDNPEQCARYWREQASTHPYFEPSVESFVVLCLNTRRRIMGHKLVSTGTLDTLLVHPREVFRPAICIAAAAIVLMHNHPSGDPTPSEADIKVTRDLIRAGQLLKIEVLDHVIMGRACPERPKGYSSLRELGYFAW
jgi:DNA repair protein RadC